MVGIAYTAEVYVVGDKVEVNYRGYDTWYPATIVMLREDGKYNVRHDDGYLENDVLKENIRMGGKVLYI